MIVWLYSFYFQFNWVYEILQKNFSTILFSTIISWLVFFFTRILVQFPRGTFERQLRPRTD